MTLWLENIHILVTLCGSFPKRVCPTWWTENEEIVSRAIEVLDNVKRVAEEFESLARSKRPKNQSWNTMASLQRCFYSS